MKVKKLVASKRTEADVDVKVADQMVGEVALDGLDGLGRDAGQRAVQEALAGELLGSDVGESPQGARTSGRSDLAAGDSG